MTNRQLQKSRRFILALICASSMMAGCAFKGNDPEKDQPSNPGQTVDTAKDQSENTDAEHTGQGDTSNEEQPISQFAYVKDLEKIDPNTNPYNIGEFFLVKNTDGSMNLLDANGDSATDVSFDKATLVLPEAGSKDSASFLAFNSNGSMGNFTLKGSSVEFMENAGGLGGVAPVSCYDPSTGKLLQQDMGTDEFVDLNLGDYDQDLQNLGENTIILVYDWNEYEKDGFETIQNSQTRYVVSLANGKVYGPVDKDSIFPWLQEQNGISIFDLEQITSTIFPVASEGKFQLIQAGQPIGEYDEAKVTGQGSVYAVKDGVHYLIEADGTKKILPENAVYCSGLNGNSILILEDNVWKLYQKS